MKIVLSNHAKNRLFQRGIKINEVVDTIEMPDYTVSKGSIKEAQKKIKDKTLKVVYSQEDKYIKVITLMWK